MSGDSQGQTFNDDEAAILEMLNDPNISAETKLELHKLRRVHGSAVYTQTNAPPYGGALYPIDEANSTAHYNQADITYGLPLLPFILLLPVKLLIWAVIALLSATDALFNIASKLLRIFLLVLMLACGLSFFGLWFGWLSHTHQFNPGLAVLTVVFALLAFFVSSIPMLVQQFAGFLADQSEKIYLRR
jgi:hypothetical protein